MRPRKLHLALLQVLEQFAHPVALKRRDAELNCLNACKVVLCQAERHYLPVILGEWLMGLGGWIGLDSELLWNLFHNTARGKLVNAKEILFCNSMRGFLNIKLFKFYTEAPILNNHQQLTSQGQSEPPKIIKPNSV